MLFVSALCSSPPFLHSTQRRLCSPAASLSRQPIVFSRPQPYYATRVNAADIENRVQELNKKSLSEEASKAGFWEEFDVRNCWRDMILAFWEVPVHHLYSPSLISSWTQTSWVSCQFLTIYPLKDVSGTCSSGSPLSKPREAEMCLFMVGSYQDSKGSSLGLSKSRFPFHCSPVSASMCPRVTTVAVSAHLLCHTL